MGPLLRKIAVATKRKDLIPQWLRNFIIQHVSLHEARTAWQVRQAPFTEEEPNSSYKPMLPYKLGIIMEFWHRHWPYIAACRDLRVAYKIIDISGPDWINVVEKSKCDAFLVWPSTQLGIWKQMYDDRLRIMVEDLNKIVYPGYKELWFYESKRRMHYWLEANDVSHPNTWVFYSREAAFDFARNCRLPIVVKTDMGAAASGVKILRKRSGLLKYVNRCFKRGIVHRDGDARETEWGSVLFQEYLPGVREWRMLRIGDSYFGYEKILKGSFHSGSHCWSYSQPKTELLDIVRSITNKWNLTSMNLDIFESQDGRYLVNELQAIFGMGNPYEMCVVDGQPGRMLYDAKQKSWQFEPGDFCQNYLCNQRILYLLKLLRAES